MTLEKPLSEQEEERAIIAFLLEEICYEAAAAGEDIKPDDAVEQLQRRLSELIAEVGDAPNWKALNEAGISIYPTKDLREAHHMAVDHYYDLHFGKARTRGRPKRPALHTLVLAAQRWHKSYKEIADAQGLETAPLDARLSSIDLVKKQVKAARERFPTFTPLAEDSPAKGKKRD